MHHTLTSHRYFKICSLFVLSFFSFQVLFQEQAVAASTEDLNRKVNSAIARTVSGVNGAESWNDLFNLLQPLPSYVTGTLKTMLYEMVPSNFEAAAVASRGVCRSGLAWLLEKTTDLDKTSAQIFADSTIWALEMESKACAARVLKKADKLTFPLFASLVPELGWDGKKLSVGSDANFTFAAKTNSLSMDGTQAQLNPATWLAATKSPQKFIAQLETLKRDINTAKVGWLESSFISQAYAAIPVLAIVIIAIVALLIAVIVGPCVARANAEDRETEYFAKIQARSLSSDQQADFGNALTDEELVEKFFAPLEQLKEADVYQWLLPGNNQTSKDLFTPCTNLQCPHVTFSGFEKTWFDTAMTLVDAVADSRVATIELLDSLDTYFMRCDQGLRESIMEMLYRIYSRVAEQTTDEAVRAHANDLKSQLLKMPTRWYYSPNYAI